MRTFFSKFGDAIISICGTLYVLVGTSPLLQPYAYHDSGVFLYAGWRMLNGEIPYRDFWDHKPPMIYLINAAGLAIGRNSRWGVWLLECCAILIAAWIGLSIGKKLFGSSPAILSMFLWLGTLVFVIQGGNFTTEYTLPLQFFALWLVYDIGERDPSPWR
jgi:4-amino-4-deoxy-L-arabinose transferase-like glycosyltransferase